MKTIYSILILLFLSCFVQAQEESSMIVLYLKDGSRLEGTIISETETNIQFRLFGDYDMDVDPAQVEKRRKGKPGRKYFSDGRWITLRGYYSILNFTTTWGKDDYKPTGNSYSEGGNLLTGLKLQSIHGYRLSRYVSLGLSLGVHSYEMPRIEEVSYGYGENNNFSSFPLELDFRGFITEKRIAPYYAVNAGYAFAVFDSERIVDRDGGVCGQLEVGVRFAGRKTGSFQLGAGYAFQHVKAVYTTNYYGGGDLRFVTLNTLVNRFILNFGWCF